MLWIVLGAAGCFALIVVLGLVATLVVPNVVRSLGLAEREQAQAEVERLCAALESYTATHGAQYPESLEALVRPDQHGHTLLGDEREPPRDPWGRSYHYEPPTPERSWPDVYSLGKDGLPGGSGANQDVHPLRARPGSR